jgi:hypothetical protein
MMLMISTPFVSSVSAADKACGPHDADADADDNSDTTFNSGICRTEFHCR